jgi:hypothetical protein
VGLTIFGADESEARDVGADGEAVGKVVEGCIGGRLGERTGVEDTLPFAPTVVQTLLLLDGGSDVAAS